MESVVIIVSNILVDIFRMRLLAVLQLHLLCYPAIDIDLLYSISN